MRADWDTYFMEIARVVSSRSTCDRKHVGALLVRDRMILSTGYNGSIRGMPHCDDVGHLLENGHCVATIHAEANAILQAARNGVRIEGADIYTTASPCWPCFKMIANAGIKRIVYGEFYRDERIFEVARKVGIGLVDLSSEKPALAPLPGGMLERAPRRGAFGGRGGSHASVCARFSRHRRVCCGPRVCQRTVPCERGAKSRKARRLAQGAEGMEGGV